MTHYRLEPLGGDTFESTQDMIDTFYSGRSFLELDTNGVILRWITVHRVAHGDVVEIAYRRIAGDITYDQQDRRPVDRTFSIKFTVDKSLEISHA